MKIPGTKRQGFIRRDIGSIPRLIKWVALSAFGVMLIITIVSGSIYYGMVLHRRGRARTLNETAKMALQSKSCIVPNFIKGLTARPRHIDIHIGYTNFQKLAYKRAIALERKVLLSSPDDYVPAQIRYRDRIINAKLRLKGDLVDQLQGEKWPFRIVIRGEDTLFGMKVFSIHLPQARGYIYEWLLHETMRREDIIALKYDFIDVTLNGKHLGIYALEEHFEKRLIENNRRREGPVICFNEDTDIRNIAHFVWPTDKRIDFYSAEIDLYRPTKTLADPLLHKQFTLARNMLESFRKGTLDVSDVFDIEILARYFALLDLFNARHAAKYGDFKLYYNPITSRLEPVCFDAELVGMKAIYMGGIYAENWYEDYLDPTHLLFKNTTLFELYMKELVRISEPSYLDSLFAGIDKQLKEKLNIIYSEYPHFYFTKDLFYSKQLYIKKILDLPVCINAYFKGFYKKDGKRFIELNISNIRPVPMNIISVRLSEETIFPVEAAEKIIQPSLPGRPNNTEEVTFVVPHDFEWKEEYANELQLNYSLLGVNIPRSEKVIPWPDLDEYFVKDDFIRRIPNTQEFEFLSMDDQAKRIFVKPGNWDLSEALIIPRGYKVICNGGTRLNLLNSAMVLSYSPFEFIGSEDEPIIISSKDSAGHGIVVLNAKQKSIFRYVIFDNLSNPSHNGWELTGALTFYESPIEISHCRFLNNRSEDGLNIVRSDFTIDKSLFNQALSDAIDADFSNGKMSNLSFADCGNDAIDISGSAVELQNIVINGAGDKGLSVGEKSRMTATDIVIKNAQIAATSKDMSNLDISNVTISDCKVGFAVYQKKSEFGPASMTVKGVTMDRIDMPHLVEEKSILILKGKKVQPNQEDVTEGPGN